MERRAAALTLGAGAVPGLLCSPDADAFDTLAWLGDERSRAAALEFSRRGHPREVRAAAIRLLGRLGGSVRLREILAEPLERVSPYETSTDWIHVQAENALLVRPVAPAWVPERWDRARIGLPAPGGFPGSHVLLFVLADW